MPLVLKGKSAERVGAGDTAICAYRTLISVQIRNRPQRSSGSKSRSIFSRGSSTGGGKMSALAATRGGVVVSRGVGIAGAGRRMPAGDPNA